MRDGPGRADVRRRPRLIGGQRVARWPSGEATRWRANGLPHRKSRWTGTFVQHPGPWGRAESAQRRGEHTSAIHLCPLEPSAPGQEAGNRPTGCQRADRRAGCARHRGSGSMVSSIIGRRFTLFWGKGRRYAGFRRGCRRWWRARNRNLAHGSMKIPGRITRLHGL